jgi:hypothetical protein
VAWTLPDGMRSSHKKMDKHERPLVSGDYAVLAAAPENMFNERVTTHC